MNEFDDTEDHQNIYFLEECDFSGAQITNSNMRKTMIHYPIRTYAFSVTDTDLSYSHLITEEKEIRGDGSDIRFRNVNFSHATIEGYFFFASFDNCDFTKATLKGNVGKAAFVNCTFDETSIADDFPNGTAWVVGSEQEKDMMLGDIFESNDTSWKKRIQVAD